MTDTEKHNEKLKDCEPTPEVRGQFTDMAHPLYEWIAGGHGWEPAITWYAIGVMLHFEWRKD